MRMPDCCAEKSERCVEVLGPAESAARDLALVIDSHRRIRLLERPRKPR